MITNRILFKKDITRSNNLNNNYNNNLKVALAIVNKLK